MLRAGIKCAEQPPYTHISRETHPYYGHARDPCKFACALHEDNRNPSPRRGTCLVNVHVHSARRVDIHPLFTRNPCTSLAPRRHPRTFHAKPTHSTDMHRIHTNRMCIARGYQHTWVLLSWPTPRVPQSVIPISMDPGSGSNLYINHSDYLSTILNFLILGS